MIQGRVHQQAGNGAQAAAEHANGLAPPALRGNPPLDAALAEPHVAQSTRAFLGFSKRAVDIACSSVAILLLSPIFMLLALLVKLESPGPVFFRSRRIGRNGVPFRMLKFRTMVAGAELQRDGLRHLSEAPDGLFKIQDDPRLTRLGHFLRSTSLDELPQLFQVLSGTMSLVGPRPLPPDEDALIMRAGLRQQARPGLTGPWQVAGSWRVPLPEMLQMDNEYLSNWSLWLDVTIVGRTFIHMVRRKGV
jgi:lipopolysaccharide/colanic/teichoic acid biosynthesis glycosyltransferase